MKTATAILVAALALPAHGEVVAVRVVRSTPIEAASLPIPYERLHLRVEYALDPTTARNRRIADIERASRTGGKVRFSADVMVLQPRDRSHSSGTAILEPVNRGGGQLLPVLTGARGRDLAAADAGLVGDGFAYARGDTLVMAGWQDFHRAPPPPGALMLDAPDVDVSGTTRESITVMSPSPHWDMREGYCARDTGTRAATLGERTTADGPLAPIASSRWRFAREEDGKRIDDPCFVLLEGGFQPDKVYELVYPAERARANGVALAALSDLASHLKHGDAARAGVHRVRHVVGYGYSQSARLLRQLLNDGFNIDGGGRSAFDGVFIAAAGAGGASVNHRYSRPGVAGNSVLTFHHPVDVFPFADAGQRGPHARGRARGQLDRAHRDGVVPKVMHFLTSSEYWARGASLLHSTVDGTEDLVIPDTSRIYFVAGTHHMRPIRPLSASVGERRFAFHANVANPRYIHRALLRGLVDWVSNGVAPPASRYPRVADGTLARADGLDPPRIGGVAWPVAPPGIWRVDHGRGPAAARQPPRVGARYALRVPAVDEDGNELGGIRALHTAVPLATYAGWNYELPSRRHVGYLSGLVGSTWRFPPGDADALAANDSRRPIAGRFRSVDAYMEQARRAATSLVSERLLLAEDEAPALEDARSLWDELSRTEGTQAITPGAASGASGRPGDARGP